jgi:Spy/CpxP family protein refolding chaperone
VKPAWRRKREVPFRDKETVVEMGGGAQVGRALGRRRRSKRARKQWKAMVERVKIQNTGRNVRGYEGLMS